MSGPYFESGYIDANYFEGDGVTQSADATLTAEASVTVSGSIIRQGDSTLTVSATHSTEIQRNRFTEVNITDAFNATITVSISKNLFSTMDSLFDWSVTASRIASNQSTLDSIITLSLQGDRSRALTATTLSSEFTQSTQIQKTLTAHSDQNSQFTLTVTANKILNAQSDQSSAFTVTSQADKVISGQSDQSTAFTVTCQANKILDAHSNQTITANITVDISKIITTQISLSDVFASTLTVDVIKNHTATLSSNSTLSCEITKTVTVSATINSDCTITVTAQRIRDNTITQSVIFDCSAQIQRILNIQSDCVVNVTITTSVSRIVNAQINLSDIFTSTLTANVTRNHTADLSSAFGFDVAVNRIGSNNINLSSNFDITVLGDRIRIFDATAQSTSALDGVISRIRPLDSALNSEFTVQGTAYRTQQFTVDLTGVFTPTLSITIFRNHTATINANFDIVSNVNAIKTVDVNVQNVITLTVDLVRIRLIETNIESNWTQSVTVNKTAVISSNQHSEFNQTALVFRIKQFVIDLNSVMTAVLTAVVNRSNIVDLSSAFEIITQANKITGYQSNINSEATVAITANRTRSSDLNISAEFTQTTTVVKIKSFEIQITDAFTATLTVSLTKGTSIQLNSNITLAATVGKLFRTGQILSAFTFNPANPTQRTTGTYNNVTVTGGSGFDAVFNFTVNNVRFITVATPVNPGYDYKKSDILTIPAGKLGTGSTATTFEIDVNDIDCQSAFTITATAVETDSFSAVFSTAITLTANTQRFRSTSATINATVKLGRTDSARTAKVITTVGGAKISTADYAFGSSSVVFDGSGDKLTVPSSTDFAFGTGDFSIEFFAKSGATFDVFNSTRNILDFRASNTNTIAPEIYLGAGNTIHYRVNGVDRISVTATTGALPYVLNTNFFNHVVVSRVNGSTRMYVDGVAAATVYTDSNDYVQGGLTIGGVVGASGNFAGYLDEIRIIKGTSPYTGNSLTVPTSSLTNTEETVLLIHGDGTNNSTNIQDDVQGFVENVKINRTASTQANIQDAFNATMTVSIILGTTANLTSTTEFTVLGTRVRLLNQGISAASTLVAQVDRIISVTADLQSTVTTTSTTDRIRSVEAQFTDVFTAQMSITVSVNLLATLDTAFAFTVIPSRLLNSNAVILSAFIISTAINGNFAVIASITSQSTLSVIGGFQKFAQSNIQARFSRVLNQGVTRTTTIIDTETPNQEYGAVGSALARFDGNSVLNISNMPQIGTGDYTIEMLAHRSAEMGDGSTFIEQDLFNADMVFRGYGVPQLGPHIYIGNDDEIKAGNTYIFNGDQITTGAFKFQTDDNLHVALVRHNGSTRLYVNGVQRGDTLADTVPWTTTEWALGDAFFGYVDEFRVSNTARYTENFTNPYANLNQDQPFVSDANTIIYLSFDTVIDEPICSAGVQRSASVSMQSRASRIVTEGGVQVSAVSKFGDNSVQFDGVDDRITILNQPALGTGNFTIEMFFRRSQTQNDSTVMTLMQMYDDADSTVSDELTININTNEQVQYVVRGDVKLISNRIFDTTDWHRVTVVRQNNVTKMWVDNQFTGDSFFDNNLINSNQVYVGNNQNLTLPYRGYVDDLQINKYSRYTTQHSTNSALPDQAYQLVGDGSSLMLHFNNAVIDLPLVEVSRVIRPATVSISSAFTPGITINTEINVAITLTSAVTFTCAVGVIKRNSAAHTAQSQLVAVCDRIVQIDCNATVISNIAVTGDLVRLFDCTAQSISSVNVSAVSTKNIQSNINTAFTFSTVVNQIVNAVASIVVSVNTQATVIRIQTADSNITANCVVNATGTRIHPGVMAITVNSTVQAQAQKIVDSNITITAICTQTVLVGEIVQFSCVIQTEASTLTVAVKTGDFFVNMDSAFGLIVDVRRTRSTSAEFNSAIEFAVTDFRFKQFEAEFGTILTQSTTVSRTRPATVSVQSETDINIIILRIKSSSTEIAVSTTHTITARKTGSGVAILVDTFTITAEPQPLNQILTVVRATTVSTLTATVRKVFLEEYEYRIREEVRTLNIVEEQRDYLIVEEQRTLTIQGAE